MTRTIVMSATMPNARTLKTIGTPKMCGALSNRPGIRAAVRDNDPESGHQRLEVIRPTDRHRDITDGVFDDQIPADDPGHQLAQRGICVGVGAAGNRNHRREFRVAQRGESTRDRGEDERQYQGRTGARTRDIARRGGADSGENPRADDSADTERRYIQRAQRFLQAVSGALRLRRELVHPLSAKQLAHH